MKYPVLKVKTIPKSYKHCGVYQAGIFRFENEELFLNDDEKTTKSAYLKDLKLSIIEAIDNNFITSQSTNINYEGQYYVLFKSNLDTRAYEIFMTNLLKEVKDYVDCDMKLYYALVNVMLFEEGKDVTILGSMKAGAEIKDSDALEKAYKEVDTSNIKGHAKYLESYEEYKQANIAKGDYYCI